jgi:hypothetical protein
MTGPRYQVRVDVLNEWWVDSDGEHHPVTERVCGHLHRTWNAADRCALTLYADRCGVCGRTRCGHGGQRVHSAAWHRAYVAEVRS